MSEDLRDQLATEPDLIIPATKAIAKSFGRAATRFGTGSADNRNPGGIARTVFQSKRLFRQYAPECAKALIKLALTAQDERVKSVALIACLGNAGVKPTDFDPNADKGDSPTINVDNLSAEERATLRALLERAVTPADQQPDWRELDDSEPPALDMDAEALESLG